MPQSVKISQSLTLNFFITSTTFVVNWWRFVMNRRKHASSDTSRRRLKKQTNVGRNNWEHKTKNYLSVFLSLSEKILFDSMTYCVPWNAYVISLITYLVAKKLIWFWILQLIQIATLRKNYWFNSIYGYWKIFHWFNHKTLNIII